MTKPTKHRPKQIIKAIQGTGGIKTTIARRLGVTRWTVDNYLARWKTVRQAYREECETVTDMAETGLIQEIKDRNFQAIKFYLQTKAKERGYSEEITINWRKQAERAGIPSSEIDVIFEQDVEAMLLLMMGEGDGNGR